MSDHDQAVYAEQQRSAVLGIVQAAGYPLQRRPQQEQPRSHRQQAGQHQHQRGLVQRAAGQFLLEKVKETAEERTEEFAALINALISDENEMEQNIAVGSKKEKS